MKRNVLIVILSVLILTMGVVLARTTTTNLGLVKPTWSENIDILDDLNANMDLIDAAFDDGAITEAKLDIDNAPTDEYVLTWEDSTGKPHWQAETGGTYLTLTDTPVAYDTGKYAKSTAAGVVWDTPAGAGTVTTSGTPVANDIARFTGATVIEGRSYAEFKADLDLEIGTDVQAFDNALTSLSGLVYVSGSFAALTGNDTYAVRTYAQVLSDIGAEGDLSNEAGLYAALSDVSDFVQAAEANSIDSAMYVDSSIDHEHLAPDIVSGMTDVTSTDADYILVWDATDSALKKVDMGEVRGGISDFVGLDDTPANFTNAGRKMVRINAGATALEFTSKSKFNNTTAPTVDNDGTEFYAAGSRWVDVTNDKEYVCLDSSTGAAVWTETTATATAGLPVTDSTGIAKGSVDATKIVRFEVDGLTTSTTRVLTVPDANITLGTAIAITDDLIVKADFADEDWGDMTVATNVVTIDADAVTYAKIQNVTATDKVLGRSSAGAGIVEEVACTSFARSILDDADEATFKATVNLEIGTDVEVDLSNEAGLYAVLSDVSDFVQSGDVNSIDSAMYVDASIDHEHLAPDVISGMTDVTSADGDYILVWDVTDSALKKCDMGEVRGGGAGETNTASNVGTGGEIYKQKTGIDLEFRKIEAGSNKIDIDWYTESGYTLVENYQGPDDGFGCIYDTYFACQTFTTTSAHNIRKVSLRLRTSGSPDSNITVELFATSAGKPTGSALATGTIAYGDVTDSYTWVDCIFISSYSLSDATLYAIVLSATGEPDGPNYFEMSKKNLGNAYADGMRMDSSDSGANWTTFGNDDYSFKVYSIGVTYKDQIEVDVNEENIKLDDLGTPDDNTDNDASTSKHGLMPKLPFSGDLLSTTTVAFNADADTTLYTVPAGKRCVLSHAIVVAAGDAGATTTLSIGANGAETDFIPANTLSNLDAQYDSVILQPIPNTTPLKIKSYVAAVIIEARVASQSGVAGNTVYLFGITY